MKPLKSLFPYTAFRANAVSNRYASPAVDCETVSLVQRVETLK